MTQVPRRAFIRAATSAVPAAALATAGPSPGSTMSLDRAALQAVGEIALPGELGAHGIERVVTAFMRWLDDYRPGAERDHGYGTGHVERLPASPRDRWKAQLAALDDAARAAAGVGFAQLPQSDRRQLVERAVASGATELPDPLQAAHVAIALLAYFYATPEATDLCYRVGIGKTTCRPLDRTSHRPAPIGRGSPS